MEVKTQCLDVKAELKIWCVGNKCNSNEYFKSFASRDA